MNKIAILSSHPIQYFAPLYAHLSKNPDLDITVLYCSDFGTKNSYDHGFKQAFQWDIDLLSGYKYEFIGKNYSFRKPKGFFSLICPSIINILYKNRFDVIWIHGHNYLVNILAIVFSKIFGTKVLMRCETHLLLSRNKVKRAIRPFVLGSLYKLCDAFLAIGTKNQNFYLSLGIPISKIFLTPYTTDNDRFIQSTKTQRENKKSILNGIGIFNDYPNVLYISKLQKRKNPDLLIKAATKIQHEINFNLIIAGSGEMLDDCVTLTKNLGVANVFFPGFVNQKTVPSFFAIADIFILLSHSEPWGLVINEAMSASLPIVASEEIGAAADLVDCDNGFQISRVNELEETIQALKILLKNPDLRNSMGLQSLCKIQSWNFSATESGFLRALDSL